MDKPKSEKILDIATKRGFVYPSAEIYGSKAGFWTYGSLGTKIKHKWENIWRKSFLSLNTNFYEIDDCNIMPKKVFESSGHLKHFNDTMTECEKCHSRFRADQIVEDTLKIDVGSLKEKELTILIRENKIKCLNCKGNLSEARFFNIMFGPFKVGVTGEDEVYLRPESAQSPYLAFKREFEATRRRLPLGLAVVGNAFRNEISPRQGFFRLREFSQAELQIFFDPERVNEHESFNKVKNYNLIIFSDKKLKKISCKEMNEKLKFPKFYVYHMVKVQEFYLNIMQIPEKLFRFRELDSNERAFYNKIHFDVELNLESLGGWKEVSGVHYRGDYDLGGHQLGSGEKLEVTIDEAGKVKRFIPHVLELSFGVDRNIWALLDIFYKEEKERTLFSFPSNLTPLDAAVFPLVNKEKLPDFSENIFNVLLSEGFTVFYDDSGSIGKRYRRQDEIGTKLCLTADFDSLKNEDVTIRDRDTMNQVRIKSKDLKSVLNKLIRENKSLSDFGKYI
ncbi:MAG TPA: glycine--tRNA ligase [Candidatus Nanoarchaeia archaeon]|nr:glycine--tRNA ligase [Candidatus Nanoarchaeia archaeon]